MLTPDKTRLGQNEGSGIVSMLKRRGYYIQSRPVQRHDSNPAPIQQIYVWQEIQDEHSYLGCIRWIKKVGWRMELVLPPLHTHQDLALSLEQLEGTKRSVVVTEKAWAEFKTSKSDRNWRGYMGALADFYMGNKSD